MANQNLFRFTSSEWLFSVDFYAPQAREIISRTKEMLVYADNKPNTNPTFLKVKRKKTCVNSLLGNWLIYCQIT